LVLESGEERSVHGQLLSAVQGMLRGQDLTAAECSACIGVIMDGEAEALDIAAFLTALSMKGLRASELSGAASAMRARSSRIRTGRSPLIDTCGTGGDELQTFNISTAAAIVLSACGASVAKHGNRSVSSRSGSADVLEHLGVSIGLTADEAGECLDDLGLAFCFAPLLHGAMKHAAPVRKQLGFPTIFNLLGPLTNPAGAEYQLLGAASDERAELLAEALRVLGGRRSLVVCGNNQLDEVALWGRTLVLDVCDGAVSRQYWTAADLGLPECDVADLRIAGADQSAAVIRDVFAGAVGPASDMVLANAGAGLYVLGRVKSPLEGVMLARSAVMSGAAGRQLERLVMWTSRAVTRRSG
jgi:anthranilate phosphoribosyltransferase